MEEDAVMISNLQMYSSKQNEIQKLQAFARRIILKKRLALLIQKKRMALKIFNTWKILKQNKRFLSIKGKWSELYSQLRKQNIENSLGNSEQDTNSESLSEINPLNPLAEDTFIKSPLILTSKLTSRCHTRETSYADGIYKGMIKKMQEEIDSLRHENSELKARRTLIPFNKFEDSAPTGGNHKDEMKDTLNQKFIDNQATQLSLEKSLEKIASLEKALSEKESHIENLSIKADYMNSAHETLEKENKYLREDLKKRENFLQHKLQLEIYVKQLERQNQKFQEHAKKAETELEVMKERSIDKDEELTLINEKKDLQNKYEGLSAKYEALKKQEEFFRKEAAEKNQQLNEKIGYIIQIENHNQELHDKVKELSISNLDYKNQILNVKNIDEELNKTRGSKKEGSENMINKKQLEELQFAFSQQNIKINKLSKENLISKEVNQALVKLLKLKNVQIQTIKMMNLDQQGNKEEAQKNLLKFQNEEKKLLKMLDNAMKQYETLNNSE